MPTPIYMKASEEARSTGPAALRRWSSKHVMYLCRDSIRIEVHGRENSTLFWSKRRARTFVSRTQFSRDMRQIVRGAGDVRTVTFPQTVREMVPGAFKKLEQLRSAILCEGLRRTPKEAFAWSGIARVRLPATLRTVGEESFYGCKSLRHVQLPDRTKKLEGHCFAMTGLEEVSVPRTVREIGQNAFYVCADLESVRLHEDSMLQKMGQNCFMRSGIAQFTVPRGVAVLEGSAFIYCTKLKSVRFQEGSALRVIE